MRPLIKKISPQKITFKVFTSLLIAIFSWGTLSWAAPGGIPAAGVISHAYQLNDVMAKLEIPEASGTIQDRFVPPGIPQYPLVIYIQDAHAQPEAQRSIANMLNHLGNQNQINGVALESGFGPLTPEILKLLPSQTANLAMANDLVEKGELSGAELFAVNHAAPSVRFHGIDDPRLYKQSYDLFRQLKEKKPEAERVLSVYDEIVRRVSKARLNPELFELIRRRTLWESREGDLLEYFRALNHLAEKTMGIQLSNPVQQFEWPNLSRIMKSIEIEPTLRWEIIRAEIDRLNHRLGASDHANEPAVRIIREGLSKLEVKDHLEQFRAWLLQHSEFTENPSARHFFETIYRETARLGIDLVAFPHLLTFGGYLILREELDAIQLFKEADALELKLETHLARSDAEREVLQLVRDVAIVRKLLALELSREDHARYEKRKAWLAPEVLRGRLQKWIDAGASVPSLSERMIRSGEKFYQLSQSRDASLLSNALAFMDQKDHGHKAIVLIAGGFHADGLTGLMRKKGVPFVVVSPKMSSIARDNLYDQVMLGRHAKPDIATAPNDHLGIELLINPGPVFRSIQTAPDRQRDVLLHGLTTVGADALAKESRSPEEIERILTGALSARQDVFGKAVPLYIEADPARQTPAHFAVTLFDESEVPNADVTGRMPIKKSAYKDAHRNRLLSGGEGLLGGFSGFGGRWVESWLGIEIPNRGEFRSDAAAPLDSIPAAAVKPKSLVVSFWKTDVETPPKARQLIAKLAHQLKGQDETEVVVIPSEGHLYGVKYVLRHLERKKIIGKRRVALGASNVAPGGAMSGKQLKRMGVQYVLIGHSSLRPLESHGTINKKMKEAVEAGLTPILAISEDPDGRASHRGDEVIRMQLVPALSGINPAQLRNLVIEYENGKPTADVEGVRQILRGVVGASIADQIRIIVGGGVDASNIKEVVEITGVNGVLAGKAGIDPDEFGKIVRAVNAHAKARHEFRRNDLMSLIQEAGLTPEVLRDAKQRAAGINEYNVRVGGVRELAEKKFAVPTEIPERLTPEEEIAFLRSVATGEKVWALILAGRATRLKLPAIFDRIGLAGLTPKILKALSQDDSTEQVMNAELEQLVDRAANGIIEDVDDFSFIQRQLIQLRIQLETLAVKHSGAGVSVDQVLAGARFVEVVNESNHRALVKQLAAIHFAGFRPPYLIEQPEFGGLEVLADGTLQPNQKGNWPEGHGDPFLAIVTRTDKIFTINKDGSTTPLDSTVASALIQDGARQLMFTQVNDLHLLEDSLLVERWAVVDRLMTERGSQMVMEMVGNEIRQKGGATFQGPDGFEFMRDTLALKTPDLEFVAIPDDLSRMLYGMNLEAMSRLRGDSIPAYLTERKTSDGRVVLTREFYSGDASSVLKGLTMKRPGYELVTFKLRSRIPVALEHIAKQDAQFGFQVFVSDLIRHEFRETPAELMRDIFTLVKLLNIKESEIPRIVETFRSSFDPVQFVNMLAKATGKSTGDIHFAMSQIPFLEVSAEEYQLRSAGMIPASDHRNKQLNVDVDPAGYKVEIGEYYQHGTTISDYLMLKQKKASETPFVFRDAMIEYVGRFLEDKPDHQTYPDLLDRVNQIDAFLFLASKDQRIDLSKINYVITSGIGANEMYSHQLAKILNAYFKAQGISMQWIVVNNPADTKRIPEDAQNHNTLVFEMSRSGTTKETVDFFNSTKTRFKTRVVAANSGPLNEAAKKLQDEEGRNNKVLIIDDIPGHIGGRQMNRKTLMTYIPLYMALAAGTWKQYRIGPINPARLLLQHYVRSSHSATQLLDYREGLNSPAVRLAEFWFRQRAAGRFKFSVVYDPTLYETAKEFLQLTNEGANKNIAGGTNLNILDSYSLSEAELSLFETVASHDAAHQMPLFLLSKASTYYNAAKKLISQLREKGIPVIVIEVGGYTIQKFRDLMGEMAAFAKLTALLQDMVVYFTYLTNQDANSNPAVKFVREITAAMFGIIQKKKIAGEKPEVSFKDVVNKIAEEKASAAQKAQDLVNAREMELGEVGPHDGFREFRDALQTLSENLGIDPVKTVSAFLNATDRDKLLSDIGEAAGSSVKTAQIVQSASRTQMGKILDSQPARRSIRSLPTQIILAEEPFKVSVAMKAKGGIQFPADATLAQKIADYLWIMYQDHRGKDLKYMPLAHMSVDSKNPAIHAIQKKIIDTFADLGITSPLWVALPDAAHTGIEALRSHPENVFMLAVISKHAYGGELGEKVVSDGITVDEATYIYGMSNVAGMALGGSPTVLFEVENGNDLEHVARILDEALSSFKAKIKGHVRAEMRSDDEIGSDGDGTGDVIFSDVIVSPNGRTNGVTEITIPANELAIDRKFGTNGIRSDDLSIDGLRRIASGSAKVLRDEWESAHAGEELPWIAVAFDPRPQGENGFQPREMGEARAIAEVIAAYGFKVLFVPKPVAAPFMIAATGKHTHPKNIYAVLMRTASHNEVVDPKSGKLVSGIKLFTENAPASDELTNKISAKINDKTFSTRAPRLDFAKAVTEGEIEVVSDGSEDDPDVVEWNRLNQVFDFAKLGAQFKARFPDLKIALNTMRGGMSKFAVKILEATGIPFEAFNTTFMNDSANEKKMMGYVEYRGADGKTKKVRFAPDPTRAWMRGQDYLNYVASDPAHIIALLIDGDADRLVAELEKEITPNEISMLGVYYLAKYKGQKGRIVRTVPTTEGLDALAEALNLGEVSVTPVGSKWFKGPNQYYQGSLEDVLLAAEESGHIVFRYKGQVFFDHSIALALLMLDMQAETGKTWNELLDEMWAFIKEKTGQERLAPVRAGIAKDEGADKYYGLVARLGNPAEEMFRTEFGAAFQRELNALGLDWQIAGYDITDAGGSKFRFAGRRSLMPRKSGTDGSVRLYIEVHESERGKVQAVETAMRKVLDQFLSRPEMRDATQVLIFFGVIAAVSILVALRNARQEAKQAAREREQREEKSWRDMGSAILGNIPFHDGDKNRDLVISTIQNDFIHRRVSFLGQSLEDILTNLIAARLQEWDDLDRFKSFLSNLLNFVNTAERTVLERTLSEAVPLLIEPSAKVPGLEARWSKYIAELDAFLERVKSQSAQEAWINYGEGSLVTLARLRVLSDKEYIISHAKEEGRTVWRDDPEQAAIASYLSTRGDPTAPQFVRQIETWERTGPGYFRIWETDRPEMRSQLLEGIQEATSALKNRDLKGQNVLVRVNLNLPMDGERITDETRIKEIVPIASFLLKKGANVILIAHHGRYNENPADDDRESLHLAAMAMAQYFPHVSVQFHTGSINAEGLRLKKSDIKTHGIHVLENVRFAHDFENGEPNDPKREAFAKGLAQLSDGIFIFDAFGDAGSEGASVEDIPRFVKEAYAGPAMAQEFKVLQQILNGFDALVFGGKKIDKIELLQGLVTKSLSPNGFALIGSGPSAELNGKQKGLLDQLRQGNADRVLTAIDYSEATSAVDIGPETIQLFLKKLGSLRPGQTVLFNGTMGWMEGGHKAGTEALLTKLKALAERGVRVVVVGGNANDVARDYKLAGKSNVILFTGGGVPLKILAGEKLVGVEALRRRSEMRTPISVKPRVIAFDLTGTLLTDGFGKAVETINRTFGIEEKQIREWLLTSDEAVKLRLGRMTSDQFWSYVLAQLNQAVQPGALPGEPARQFFAGSDDQQKTQLKLWLYDAYEEIPGTNEMIQELVAAGYIIIVYTNMEAERVESLKRQFDWLRPIRIITSSQVEVTKPDRRGFEAVVEILQREGIEITSRHDIYYVDDDAENLEAPKAMGWQTQLVEPSMPLHESGGIRDLVALGRAEPRNEMRSQEPQTITDFAERLHVAENIIVQAATEARNVEVIRALGDFFKQYLTITQLTDVQKGMLIDHSLWRIFAIPFARHQLPTAITISKEPQDMMGQMVLVTVLGRFVGEDQHTADFVEEIQFGNHDIPDFQFQPIVAARADVMLQRKNLEKQTPPMQADDLSMISRAEMRTHEDWMGPEFRIGDIQESKGGKLYTLYYRENPIAAIREDRKYHRFYSQVHHLKPYGDSERAKLIYFHALMEYLHRFVHATGIVMRWYETEHHGFLKEFLIGNRFSRFAQNIHRNFEYSGQLEPYRAGEKTPFRDEADFRFGDLIGKREIYGTILPPEQQTFQLVYHIGDESEDQRTILVPREVMNKEYQTENYFLVLPEKNVLAVGTGTILSKVAAGGQKLGIRFVASNRSPNERARNMVHRGIPLVLLDAAHADNFNAAQIPVLESNGRPVALLDLAETGALDGVAEHGRIDRIIEGLSGKDKSGRPASQILKDALFASVEKAAQTTYQAEVKGIADTTVSLQPLHMAGLTYQYFVDQFGGHDNFSIACTSCNETNLAAVVAALSPKNTEKHGIELAGGGVKIHTDIVRRRGDPFSGKDELVADIGPAESTGSHHAPGAWEIFDGLPKEYQVPIARTTAGQPKFTSNASFGTTQFFHRGTIYLTAQKKDGSYLGVDEMKALLEGEAHIVPVSFANGKKTRSPQFILDALFNQMLLRHPMIAPVEVTQSPLHDNEIVIHFITFQESNVLPNNVALLLLTLGLVKPENSPEAMELAYETLGVYQIRKELLSYQTARSEMRLAVPPSTAPQSNPIDLTSAPRHEGAARTSRWLDADAEQSLSPIGSRAEMRDQSFTVIARRDANGVEAIHGSEIASGFRPRNDNKTRAEMRTDGIGEDDIRRIWERFEALIGESLKLHYPNLPEPYIEAVVDRYLLDPSVSDAAVRAEKIATAREYFDLFEAALREAAKPGDGLPQGRHYDFDSFRVVVTLTHLVKAEAIRANGGTYKIVIDEKSGDPVIEAAHIQFVRDAAQAEVTQAVRELYREYLRALSHSVDRSALDDFSRSLEIGEVVGKLVRSTIEPSIGVSEEQVRIALGALQTEEHSSGGQEPPLDSGDEEVRAELHQVDQPGIVTRATQPAARRELHQARQPGTVPRATQPVSRRELRKTRVDVSVFQWEDRVSRNPEGYAKEFGHRLSAAERMMKEAIVEMIKFMLRPGSADGKGAHLDEFQSPPRSIRGLNGKFVLRAAIDTHANSASFTIWGVSATRHFELAKGNATLEHVLGNTSAHYKQLKRRLADTNHRLGQARSELERTPSGSSVSVLGYRDIDAENAARVKRRALQSEIWELEHTHTRLSRALQQYEESTRAEFRKVPAQSEAPGEAVTHDGKVRQAIDGILRRQNREWNSVRGITELASFRFIDTGLVLAGSIPFLQMTFGIPAISIQNSGALLDRSSQEKDNAAKIKSQLKNAPRVPAKFPSASDARTIVLVRVGSSVPQVDVGAMNLPQGSRLIVMDPAGSAPDAFHQYSKNGFRRSIPIERVQSESALPSLRQLQRIFGQHPDSIPVLIFPENFDSFGVYQNAASHEGFVARVPHARDAQAAFSDLLGHYVPQTLSRAIPSELLEFQLREKGLSPVAVPHGQEGSFVAFYLRITASEKADQLRAASA